MMPFFRNIYSYHFNIYEIASYIVSVRKSKYLDETKFDLMYRFHLYFVTIKLVPSKLNATLELDRSIFVTTHYLMFMKLSSDNNVKPIYICHTTVNTVLKSSDDW